MSQTCPSCGREVHSTVLCARCTHTLEVALGNTAAGQRRLDEMRTRLRGRRYDLPRGKGGTKHQPAGMDLRFDLVTRDDDGRVIGGHGTALEVDTRNTLVGWVRVCQDLRPNQKAPANTIPAMCAWLASRRKAIAGQEWAPELLRDVLDLERRFKRLLNVGPEPIFAGLCLVCGVFGERVALYGHRGDTELQCPECGDVVDAAKRWDTMLADLDGRLCPAAEIARLATYFGLLDDRDRVRNRINQWHKRGVIGSASVNLEGEPLFVFGDVVTRLLTADSERRATRKPA